MTDRAEFRDNVKDALTHLHDLAHLESHPLARQLPTNEQPSSISRGQRLRSILKKAVEALQPPDHIPAHMPEWRSYRVLYYRYIKGLGFADMEYELGLSRRQLQREEHKGVDAVSSMLWNHRILDEPEEGRAVDAGETRTMLELLRTWQVERQACPIWSLVQDARSVLESLLDNLASIIEDRIPRSMTQVIVDPVLTRQAVLRVLRLLANSIGPGHLVLDAFSGENMATLVFEIPQADLDLDEEDWQMASLLVSRQGGELKHEVDPAGRHHVSMRLPQLSQARLLVVDDVRAAHKLFERYLAPHNYEIIGTSDPDEAVRLAQQAQPDGIILDVMMPAVDGWQVLRDLQSHSATAAIPVIVCSVLDEPQLALSLGAKAFVKKPVQQLELLGILDRLFSRASPC